MTQHHSEKKLKRFVLVAGANWIDRVYIRLSRHLQLFESSD